jgi:hypothetical protein
VGSNPTLSATAALVPKLARVKIVSPSPEPGTDVISRSALRHKARGVFDERRTQAEAISVVQDVVAST